MLIKGQQDRNSENSLPDGSLLCYEQDGKPCPGVVMGWNKSKYAVINLHGQQLDLSPDRIHKLPGSLPPGCDDRTARISFLEMLDSRARALVAEISIEKVWESLPAEAETDNETICKACFGQNGPAQHLATRYALLGDQTFFKRKKNLFQARPAQTVLELKGAAQRQQQKQQEKDALVEFAAARLKQPSLTAPESLKPWLRLLEDLAIDSQDLDNNRRKEAKLLLESIAQSANLQLAGSLSERAWQLLTSIAHFSENTSPALLRSRLTRDFPVEVLSESKKIQAPLRIDDLPPEDRLLREDITDLSCFTIDDASTADMDDAISLVKSRDGYELGIHISDVSAYVKPGSALDKSALERATSVYCPDILINMLPENLSESLASLVEGQPRPALSLFFSLDHSFRITHSRFCPTMIKVTKRLSYEDADQMLETGHSEMNVLYNIASSCEAERFAKGGFRVDKRDVNAVLGPDGSVSLVEIDENAPSRRMIGELMVLTNKTCAEYAIANGLPLFFRSQDGPSEGLLQQISRIPAGPAADYALRYQLKKSLVSPEPAWHATLGIEAYAQCSSPIRRYSDLCNQRQILQHLRTGRACYDREQIAELISKLNEPLKTAAILSRESRRFWLQQYLKRSVRQGNTIEATVLRTDYQNPLVELDIVFFSALARVHSRVRPGDRIKLRIESIDPRYDLIRLEEAN